MSNQAVFLLLKPMKPLFLSRELFILEDFGLQSDEVADAIKTNLIDSLR